MRGPSSLANALRVSRAGSMCAWRRDVTEKGRTAAARPLDRGRREQLCADRRDSPARIWWSVIGKTLHLRHGCAAGTVAASAAHRVHPARRAIRPRSAFSTPRRLVANQDRVRPLRARLGISSMSCKRAASRFLRAPPRSNCRLTIPDPVRGGPDGGDLRPTDGPDPRHRAGRVHGTGQAMLAFVTPTILNEPAATPYHQPRAYYAQRVVGNPHQAAAARRARRSSWA